MPRILIKDTKLKILRALEELQEMLRDEHVNVTDKDVRMFFAAMLNEAEIQ